MIENFKKNYYKYVIIIFLYIFYQANTVINIIKACGFNILKLPRTPRIICFTLLDLLFVLIALFLFRKEIKKCISDFKENFNDRSYLALKCWLLGSILMTTSSALISLITKQNVSENETIVRDSIKIAPLYMLFSCAIFAPVYEELIFRRTVREFSKTKKRYIIVMGSLITFALIYLFGFKLHLMENIIPKKLYPTLILLISSFIGYFGIYLATKFVKLDTLFIITSGILFGLLHIIGSYTSAYDLLYIIPYGSMGSCFAYLLLKTDNIVLTMSIHAIHNTILVFSQLIRIFLIK